MCQSAFKDIWGSYLIFAGPHKSFTNVNKSSNANNVVFGIHSITSNFEDEQDDCSNERVSAMVADELLGLAVHPFPFHPQDILDMGEEKKPDFEELVNSCNQVMGSCWNYVPRSIPGQCKYYPRIFM